MSDQGDQAIDALARSLPPIKVDAARVERVRTELLAAAGGITPRPARVIDRRVIVGAGAAAALAAAVALWLVAGAREERAKPVARAIVTPAAGSQLERVSAAPDEIVRLRHGELALSVPALPAGERFRAITDDAEIEAREARWTMVADGGRLARADVQGGSIVVRVHGQPARTIVAGQAWTAAPRVETAEVVVPPPEPAPDQPPSIAEAPKVVKRTKSPTQETQPPAAAPAPAAPPAPGEAEFRKGWDALKAGDATRAAELFAASRRAGPAFAEDATYWQGVALARTGRRADAIATLRGHLREYPRAARRGEAAARLGWLLVDAGQRDEARRWFEIGARDRVPAVRDSAREGLERLSQGNLDPAPR